MRVVVVGGGYGGMASAARLAKLGHEVTLLERSGRLGGALTTIEAEGFAWDAGPHATLLPAVVRDLFRKSGRPLEKEVGELEPREVIREHRFEDRTSVRLPGGSRAAQKAAFDELGPGLGDAWIHYVDEYAVVWDVLRRHYFEVPWRPDELPREVAAYLDGRETMHKRLRRSFRDDRLAMIAAHPLLTGGHDLRNVPSWAGLTAYLEQCFGVWTVPGGMARISDALERRLATRGVTVLTGEPAVDLLVRDGRVAAVRTGMGEVAADAVVCAVDPRRLPALAPYVERTMPAIPPVVAHLGHEGEVPELPPETVLHGDATIEIHTGGRAPEGCHAWTLHGRGKIAEDMLLAIARMGVKVRDNVVVRIDRSPRQMVENWGGSPMGVLWQGRGTVRHRLGPTTPIPGVYAAGAHATPGAGLPFVGLSAALVAQEIGPA
jgi:phytoene dehydrogenase-like protein